MSRKISLTRIHAINWYGYHDSIPISGNLLLAGVTGSGKSILMDLIQLVLVGNQKARYNQSATGSSSQRSLKGYCLGDTKQEENGVVQYLREKGAITYVALEFTWPDGKRVETWGLRIEFRSAAEENGRINSFFCQGALSRSDFLDDKRCPIDFPSFKQLVQKKEGRIFETLEQYLREIAAPVHLNFEPKVLERLLPTAMSFTFLKSFNEFCRLFILPADRLNVEDVIASYKMFCRYEDDLRLLNDQMERLMRIRNLFEQHSTMARDKVVARYLQFDLGAQYARSLLCEREEQLAQLHQAFAQEEARLAALDDYIEKRKAQIDQIKSLINQSADGQIYSYLKGENRRLVRDIEQLRMVGDSLEGALQLRRKKARWWKDQLAALPSPAELSTRRELDQAVKDLEQMSLDKSDSVLKALHIAAQNALNEVSRVARPVQEQVQELRREQGRLRDEIAALEVGKLPFPAVLLDALNAGLPHYNHELPAQSLCRLCEVIDERWRPAVEVAFTRKFAVVVSAEHYNQAEQIHQSLRGDTSRESLVHPTKALRMARSVKNNSLATKLRTEHPVAHAIISNLFGDLLCVERREELQQHEFAIMPDGFMVRGAFAERRRHYDNFPYVGRRGLEQQLAAKKGQLQELILELRRHQPLLEAVEHLHQSFRDCFPEHSSLAVDLIKAQQLPSMEAQLLENIQRLNSIDRDSFDERERQLQALERELMEWESERRQLLTSQRRGDIQRLEQGLKTAAEESSQADARLERVKSEIDISLYLGRLEEMRREVIGQFNRLDLASREIGERYHQWDKQAEVTRQQLIEERRLLAVHHTKFDELSPEEEGNASYERHLLQVEEGDIPGYREKAAKEKKNWENLFRTQILEKMRAALFEVDNVISLLNNYLRTPIGHNRYQIQRWQNSEFKTYHRLLEVSALHHKDELFFASVDSEARVALEHFLKILLEQPDSVEAVRLLDYRFYYEYDMLVTDVRDPGAKPLSVDRHSGKFSGGENQSPYFIAILASYLRAYKRHETRRKDPSLALVPIDEAFSKLSGERIRDCINALRSLDLQGVFSMSSGNIPYAFDLCDHLLVVSKHEKRVGKKMEIRNVAVSLERESEEAQALIQAHT